MPRVASTAIGSRSLRRARDMPRELLFQSPPRAHESFECLKQLIVTPGFTTQHAYCRHLTAIRMAADASRMSLSYARQSRFTAATT